MGGREGGRNGVVEGFFLCCGLLYVKLALGWGAVLECSLV